MTRSAIYLDETPDRFQTRQVIRRSMTFNNVERLLFLSRAKTVAAPVLLHGIFQLRQHPFQTQQVFFEAGQKIL